MRPPKMDYARKEVHKELIAPPVLPGIHEVISTAAFRRNDVWFCSFRNLLPVDGLHRESKLQRRTAIPRLLIFHGHQPFVIAHPAAGFDRIERSQAKMILMHEVG